MQYIRSVVFAAADWSSITRQVEVASKDSKLKFDFLRVVDNGKRKKNINGFFQFDELQVSDII